MSITGESNRWAPNYAAPSPEELYLEARMVLGSAQKL